MNIAFFNPGGLLCGDEEGKFSKKAVQLGREVRLLKDNRGEVDILCISESHLREDSVQNVPQKFLGFAWMHETALVNDKAAGVSIGYRWWMPKPMDLLLQVWKEADNVDHDTVSALPFELQDLPKIRGRLQVVVFQLQELDVIVCNFYGRASESLEKRYDLIILATGIIKYVVDAWMLKSINNRKTTVVWGGDFNAYSNAIARISTPGEPLSTASKCCGRCRVLHKPATKCVAKAMDNVEETFTHVNVLAPCVDGAGKYFTYECWEHGECTRQNGIDHIYFMRKCAKGELFIPDLHFWHGYPGPSQQSSSGHHMLTTTLSNVWSCAINRKAKGTKAPFKRLGAWLFSDEGFMTGVKEKAEDAYMIMSDPSRASICSQWDLLFAWIPTYAKHYVKAVKKKLIKRKNDCFHDPHNGKKEEQMQDLEADWEILDPIQQARGQFNDCGIAGSRVSPEQVYTAPACVRSHIFQTFSEKYQKRNGMARKRAKSIREWMKFAPKRISKEESDDLEECVSIDSIIKAIDSMDANAAPGVDGISLHLFTHALTKEIFAKILVLVVEDAIKNGRLPNSMRSSVIRLLQKEGKDNTDISLKRPVSLMSIPTRIVAKCIAMALSAFMDDWIGDHQKAYIKGRRIEVNIAIISILLQQSQKLDRDDLKFLMMLEVDFKSAFDTVDHEYIKALLLAIGVGEKMRKIIMLIVGTLEAQVIINSELSESFGIRRGVPQGCSLSGILFILVLECLFNKAMSDPQTFGKGVALLEGSEELVGDITFADDVNILRTNPDHIQAWWMLLQEFNFPSGLALSLPKSGINLLGHGFSGEGARNAEAMVTELSTRCPGILQVGIANDVKTVGVLLSVKDLRNGMEISSKSWPARIGKFTSYVKALKSKMEGSKLLDKIPEIHEGLSRLWYLSLNCPISEKQASDIYCLVDQCVWSHARPDVKREVYTQDVTQPGGLNAPDPSARIKSMQTGWVKMLACAKLPACLAEVFNYQIRRGCAEGSESIQPCDKAGFSQAGFNNLIAKFKNGDKKKIIKNCDTYSWFKPLFLAIGTLSQIPEVPTDEQGWVGMSAKSVYKSLKNLTRHDPSTVGVIPGQEKWENLQSGENLRVDWPMLWRVVASLRHFSTDLHDALYRMIVRRFVVPSVAVAGAPPSASTKKDYAECVYCTGSLYAPSHALFECSRIKEVWDDVALVVWQKAPSSVDDLKQKVFTTCEKIGISAKRPVISLAQLFLLCSISEILGWIKGHTVDSTADRVAVIRQGAGLDQQEFKSLMLERIRVRVRENQSLSEDEGIG